MKYLIALCLAASLSAPARAQEENFTGKIFTAAGIVEVQTGTSNAWTQIKAPVNIEAGDKVRTGPGSTAEIYIKYGAKVRLNSGTTFILDTSSKEGSTMQVMLGKMQAWFRKTGRKFSVRTPSAVCAIRGTVLDVEVAQSGETVWNLFSGSIQVSNANNTVTRDVLPNQRITVTKTEVTQPEALPAEVTAPVEPKKIKEEKAEIKTEEKAAKEAQKSEEAKAKTDAEAAAKLAPEVPPVVEEPVLPPVPVEPPSVIPSQELSPSNP